MLWIAVGALLACAGGTVGPTSNRSPTDGSTSGAPTDGNTDAPDSGSGAVRADVVEVSVTGSAGNYSFSVALRSDDLGCKQYADWWEVLSADGTLVYRRILTHSHVSEQPFTRSGGPVDVQPDEVVLVRGHMNTGGYDGGVMRGTAASGFVTVDVEDGFAADVESLNPQPSGCLF